MSYKQKYTYSDFWIYLRSHVYWCSFFLMWICVTVQHPLSSPWITSFSISYRTAIHSLIFAYLGMSWFLLNFLRIVFLDTHTWLAVCFFSTLCHIPAFWPLWFLIRDQLLILLRTTCMWWSFFSFKIIFNLRQFDSPGCVSLWIYPIWSFAEFLYF